MGEKAISIGDRSRFEDCADWGKIYIFGAANGNGSCNVIGLEVYVDYCWNIIIYLWVGVESIYYFAVSSYIMLSISCVINETTSSDIM